MSVANIPGDCHIDPVTAGWHSNKKAVVAGMRQVEHEVLRMEISDFWRQIFEAGGYLPESNPVRPEQVLTSVGAPNHRHQVDKMKIPAFRTCRVGDSKGYCTCEHCNEQVRRSDRCNSHRTSASHPDNPDCLITLEATSRQGSDHAIAAHGTCLRQLLAPIFHESS